MSYLEFKQIGKVFPGVKALSDISFQVNAGSVHALLGENGAGKSTLIKILGGEHVPDEGVLSIDGQPRRFANSRDSIDAGVSIIHQELQYVADLTVMENLLLGHLPNRFGFVSRKQAMRLVDKQLKSVGVDIPAGELLRNLSIGQRQMLEICKAIFRDAKIIALDEPTSSLSHGESEILFRMVRALKSQGKAVIYISHRLDEVFALCDSATVFRDGRKVGDFPQLREVSREELVRKMVGRDIQDVFGYKPRNLGDIRLQVRQLAGRKLSRPVSFSARRGEIVGFFGLVGAGRSELMQLIYGAEKPSGGEVRIDGEKIESVGIPYSIRSGLVFCPEDRKEDGIVGCLSVAENINISCRRHHRLGYFFVRNDLEKRTADRYIKRLRIKTPSRQQKISFLSGGNQQKVILSRWLAEQDLRVLIVDEPTRGIDIGAKNEIYAALFEMAESGVAIIMVSSELPEVLGVSDRVVVMCQGEVVGELDRAAASEQSVLKLALPAGRGAPKAMRQKEGV
ncbi:L-arabinose ABC transporter ATP-binding protein AraG [Xenophilus sp. AP218F]|nr:L-arabinose ABC transporter ATP-binding protein AraG [Xenophilus sp. AP218F]